MPSLRSLITLAIASSAFLVQAQDPPTPDAGSAVVPVFDNGNLMEKILKLKIVARQEADASAESPAASPAASEDSGSDNGSDNGSGTGNAADSEAGSEGETTAPVAATPVAVAVATAPALEADDAEIPPVDEVFQAVPAVKARSYANGDCDDVKGEKREFVESRTFNATVAKIGITDVHHNTTIAAAEQKKVAEKKKTKKPKVASSSSVFQPVVVHVVATSTLVSPVVAPPTSIPVVQAPVTNNTVVNIPLPVSPVYQSIAGVSVNLPGFNAPTPTFVPRPPGRMAKVRRA